MRSISGVTSRVKDRRGDQRGVNGSQLRFLTEFGLYPKINPNPLNQNEDLQLNEKDNRTHAVMCLGEKPVKSIASGSAKTQVTTAEHTRTERDGTRSVRPLREAPQSPTAWKTGAVAA
jgi:hypothetical protein